MCQGVPIDFPFFGSSGSTSLCLGTFIPNQGVASGGLYSTLAFIFNLMFMVLFILWLISILLSVYEFIKSEGNQDLIESGKNRFLNLMRGTSLGLAAFVIASGLGLLLGAGSPFDWPKVLAQCTNTTGRAPNTPDRRIFLNASRDIGQTSRALGAAPGTKVDILCCDVTGWNAIAGIPGEKCEFFDSIIIP